MKYLVVIVLFISSVSNAQENFYTDQMPNSKGIKKCSTVTKDREGKEIRSENHYYNAKNQEVKAIYIKTSAPIGTTASIEADSITTTYDNDRISEKRAYLNSRLMSIESYQYSK